MISHKKMLVHLKIMESLLDLMWQHADNAYELITSYNSDHRYIASSFHYSSAYSNFLQFKVYYQSNELDEPRFNSVVNSFYEFKNQLDVMIVEKSENASHLESAKEQLYDSYKKAYYFLEELKEKNK